MAAAPVVDARKRALDQKKKLLWGRKKEEVEPARLAEEKRKRAEAEARGRHRLMVLKPIRGPKCS